MAFVVLIVGVAGVILVSVHCDAFLFIFLVLATRHCCYQFVLSLFLPCSFCSSSCCVVIFVVSLFILCSVLLCCLCTRYCCIASASVSRIESSLLMQCFFLHPLLGSIAPLMGAAIFPCFPRYFYIYTAASLATVTTSLLMMMTMSTFERLWAIYYILTTA